MSYPIRNVLLGVVCSVSWVAFAAHAQSSQTEPNQNDKLQADLCASKTGDARDACLREGQDRQISTGVRGDVRAESTNSDYNVARAKCDTLSGTARDNCVTAAKKKYKQ
jgi:hypothetical protein